MCGLYPPPEDASIVRDDFPVASVAQSRNSQGILLLAPPLGGTMSLQPRPQCETAHVLYSLCRDPRFRKVQRWVRIEDQEATGSHHTVKTERGGSQNHCNTPEGQVALSEGRLEPP